MEHNKDSKREHHPRPSGVANCHAPNSVEGCHDKDYEQSKANEPHLHHRIQIAIVGIRHGLQPALSLNDARRVGSYEPKGFVSPSQERPMSDLISREIPNKYTTRESRIVEYEPSHPISEKYEKRYYNEYKDRRGNAHLLSDHQRKSSQEWCKKSEAHRCFGMG